MTTTFGVGLNTSTCAPFSNPDIHPNKYDWQTLVYFTPAAWVVGRDGDVPNGTKVGSFDSKVLVGLLNNPCQTVLRVRYDLLEGSIDQTNTVDEKPETSPDRLSPMAADINANHVPDVADRWPSYLTAVAEKQGMDLSQLVARYVGVNNYTVAGTTVVANYLVFRPGAAISSQFLLDPDLGYPMVVILQGPTSPSSPQDPLTDVCAPLWNQLTLDGTAGATTVRGNPPDGVYDFTTFTIAQPDADGDGIENRLDPCPYSNSSNWDPRGHKVQPGGDSDGDGIPDDCDPFPHDPSLDTAGNGIIQSDEDGDGWANMVDNCPLVANGLDQAGVPGVGNQTDTDADGIGDACDHNPTTFDTRSAPLCLVSMVTIGTGGPRPSDPQNTEPCTPANACTCDPPTPSPSTSPTPTPSLGPTVTPARLPDAGGAPSDGPSPWQTVGIIGAAISLFGLGFAVARRRLLRMH